MKKNINSAPKAWLCHDVLLKHQRAKRKGVLFTTPLPSKKSGFLGKWNCFNPTSQIFQFGLDLRSSVDQAETLPLELDMDVGDEVPPVDETDLFLSSFWSLNPILTIHGKLPMLCPEETIRWYFGSCRWSSAWSFGVRERDRWWGFWGLLPPTYISRWCQSFCSTAQSPHSTLGHGQCILGLECHISRQCCCESIWWPWKT